MKKQVTTNPKSITILDNLSGNFSCSNPFEIISFVNSESFPKKARLITRADLENNPHISLLQGFCVDFGLNLTSQEKGNSYSINPQFANPLAEDLRYIGISLETAKLIPYDILTCRLDERAPGGLVFNLSEPGKDDAKKFILNTFDFKWDYSPDWRNYSDSGLFRAVLYPNSRVDPWVDDLGLSLPLGRLVVTPRD